MSQLFVLLALQAGAMIQFDWGSIVEARASSKALAKLTVTCSSKPAVTPRTPTAARFAAYVDDGKRVSIGVEEDVDWYWQKAKIHNFGNTGIPGRIHAFVAPIATYIIDKTSYGGRNVRKEVHQMIAGSGTVLDLCCGTGFSTAHGAVGVDASVEMLGMARSVHPLKTFQIGNAETYGALLPISRHFPASCSRAG